MPPSAAQRNASRTHPSRNAASRAVYTREYCLAYGLLPSTPPPPTPPTDDDDGGEEEALLFGWRKRWCVGTRGAYARTVEDATAAVMLEEEEGDARFSPLLGSLYYLSGTARWGGGGVIIELWFCMGAAGSTESHAASVIASCAVYVGRYVVVVVPCKKRRQDRIVGYSALQYKS